MEPWLLDITAQAVDAPNCRHIEDDVEAGELVQKRRGHLHDHLHNHLELFAFLEQAGDSQVSHHEGKRKQRGAICVILISAVRVQFYVCENRENLADQL